MFASAAKEVQPRVKLLLSQIQMAQQSVRCTDAYRVNTQKKFTSLRVWSGSQLVFFTLNPADTKHQFTVSFASAESFGDADNLEEHHFLLTQTGDEKCRFYNNLKPLQLRKVVAADPVACVRCFYLLVRLVCEHLLHCTIDSKSLHADGVASKDGEGIPMGLQSEMLYILTTIQSVECVYVFLRCTSVVKGFFLSTCCIHV